MKHWNNLLFYFFSHLKFQLFRDRQERGDFVLRSVVDPNRFERVDIRVIRGRSHFFNTFFESQANQGNSHVKFLKKKLSIECHFVDVYVYYCFKFFSKKY